MTGWDFMMCGGVWWAVGGLGLWAGGPGCRGGGHRLGVWVREKARVVGRRARAATRAVGCRKRVVMPCCVGIVG